MSERIIIDPDSGEVTGRLEPGDRIIKGNTLEFLKDTQVWKIEHFYKTNISEIYKWMRDLSVNEKALLFTISPCVGYEDCCLKFENGKILSFENIVELSRMSKSVVAETLGKLIKKDILYKGKNSEGIQYFINPWLYAKGNRINAVLKTMFKNYQIRVINKKWGEL